MTARKPVVRHFLVCERLDISPDGRHVSLVNVIYAIRPVVGVPHAYPRVHPELWVFAQMSDAHGVFNLSVELVRSDDEESIFRTPPVRLNFGSDPLAVRGWSKQMLNIPFHQPGLYEFGLLCDEQIIAREPILLKESP